MANIMLTENCNLKCSYCFANEYVNQNHRDISMENFRRAVDFICAGGDRTLGLIGGEPTLHSCFRDILIELKRNDALRGVSLFTNGIYLDRFAKELSDKKFSILINCNAPEVIGTVAYERVLCNIELLIDKYDLRDQMTLGVNIFRPDFRYDYLLETLHKFGFQQVRMSLTVPNTAYGRAYDPHRFFLEMKPILVNFVSDMLSVGIVPHYDCNKMPICLFTDDEKTTVINLAKKLPKESLRPWGHSSDSSIFSDEVGCSPVVDILPDLTAVRCFGLSSHTRVNISDFHNVSDLRRYYANEIDSYAYKAYTNERCNDCYLRKTARCTSGCLAYRIHDALSLRDVVKREASLLQKKERS